MSPTVGNTLRATKSEICVQPLAHTNRTRRGEHSAGDTTCPSDAIIEGFESDARGERSDTHHADVGEVVS